MGRLIIEIRISRNIGKSAENSVVDLMPILFVMATKRDSLYVSRLCYYKLGVS